MAHLSGSAARQTASEPAAIVYLVAPVGRSTNVSRALFANWVYGYELGVRVVVCSEHAETLAVVRANYSALIAVGVGAREARRYWTYFRVVSELAPVDATVGYFNGDLMFDAERFGEHGDGIGVPVYG